MAFTVYSSADTGAPVLSATDRATFLNLLHQCLVTGYGSKPAAGWEAPFGPPSTTSAVFRQQDCGLYVRVSTNSNYFYSVDVYQNMTDPQTGSGQLCPISTNAGTGVWAINNANNTFNPSLWYVFADDKSVYVLLNAVTSSNGTGWCVYHFGKAISYNDDYEYLFVVTGRPARNVSSAICINTSIIFRSHADVRFATDPNYRLFGNLSKKINGSWSSVPMEIGVNPFLGGAVAKNSWSDPFYSGFLGANDGKIFIEPAWIIEESDITSYFVAGRLRGLWLSWHNSDAFPFMHQINGSNTMENRSFLFIPKLQTTESYASYDSINVYGQFVAPVFLEISDTLDM